MKWFILAAIWGMFCAGIFLAGWTGSFPLLAIALVATHGIVCEGDPIN